jgi:hypothetical protein
MTSIMTGENGRGGQREGGTYGYVFFEPVYWIQLVVCLEGYGCCNGVTYPTKPCETVVKLKSEREHMTYPPMKIPLYMK